MGPGTLFCLTWQVVENECVQQRLCWVRVHLVPPASQQQPTSRQDRDSLELELRLRASSDRNTPPPPAAVPPRRELESDGGRGEEWWGDSGGRLAGAG